MDITLGRYRSPSFHLIATYLLIVASPLEMAFKIEQILYVICFALLLLDWIYSTKYKIKIDASILLLLFSAYSLLTTINSPANGAYRSLFVKIVVLMVLYLQLQFDYSAKDLNTIRQAFLLQLIVTSVITTIYGSVYIDGRFWIINGPVSTDPNSLCAWFIIPVCFLVEGVFTKGLKRILYLLLLVVAVSIVIKTVSRGGIVCIAIALVLSIMCAMRSLIKKTKLLAFVILIILVCGVSYLWQYLPRNVLTRFSTQGASGLGGRTRIWSLIYYHLERYPLGILIGNGEGSMLYYFSVVAHNMYLEILFSQGCIGLSMVGGFIIHSMKKTIRKDPYIAIAFICVLIMSATLSEFTSRPVMLSLFLAGISDSM